MTGRWFSGGKWIGFAVAVALLAACAPAFPVPARDTPAPVGDEPPLLATAIAVATALPTVLAGWQTYVDPEGRYSFSYPQDVHFTAGNSKAGIYTARLQFRIPGVTGYQGMLIRAEPNPGRHGIETILADLYRRAAQSEPPAGLLAEAQQLTVAGLSGVQVGTGGDFSVVVPYGDWVYILAPVHDAALEIDPRALALFYQVLATLQVKR